MLYCVGVLHEITMEFIAIFVVMNLSCDRMELESPYIIINLN